MTAINGAVASKGASASEKTCLFKARVQPLSAMLHSPAGLLAYHAISEPRVLPVPTYQVPR